MTKKARSSASAGTTANPAPQPNSTPAPATSAQAAAPARTNGAAVSGKSTAGPATLQVLPATETGPSVEESALADFAALMSGVGSETPAPQPARRIKAAESLMDASDEEDAAPDETPALNGEAAEDSEPNAGEEPAAELDEAGDNDLENSNSQTTEEGSEQEPDDDSTDEHGKPWPKSYLRRLAREKEKRERIEDRLESELSTLKAEMEELRAKPAENQASHQPVTDVEQTLTQKVKAAESIIDFVDDNPDGATTPDGRSWTREQLRAEKRKAERELREAEVNLAASRQERQELDAAIKAELPRRHPWITDRQHNATVAMNALLRKYPVLNSHPLFRAMVADSIGMEMLRQRAAKKSPDGVPAVNGNGTAHARVAAPPPPRPVVRSPGRPGTVPAPVNGKRAAYSELEKRAYETGDSEATKALLQHVLAG